MGVCEFLVNMEILSHTILTWGGGDDDKHGVPQGAVMRPTLLHSNGSLTTQLTTVATRPRKAVNVALL